MSDAATVPLIEPGVDSNGIKTGDWKAPIFGCFDTFVPNAGSLNRQWLNVLSAVLAVGLAIFKWNLRTKVRTMFAIPGVWWEDALCTIFCSCCSLAQIATHVESYTPGACSFDAKATLQGYRL
ncbi:hypothetical protein DYB37_001066 [Aphanomyces astaci]|uniref:PLAC8 family protein n=1 Tax=Aphanomyces astaci TaxID=112090 RepID=A0A397F5V3_APHAT|nr:hypothetical protein DYB36_006680 [Aphanomyces astaci]RHY44918.1 hypothetical protein DYB34_001925 [Aphanomyces astaci]RHZ15150.1 hypothetical protein DYB31_007170 [Aphanomyces astaci]RHZ16898.1 hypothetical protein DYB37_001066 [Aphanomyces astaci]RQM22843.1 hypothetical protein B5M09_002491 [Aphanomyces astaci]